MTDIEWTHIPGYKGETWNPVRGCTKISPGCKHCYAETFAERWRGIPGHAYEQGFDLREVPSKLDQPVRWTKPRSIFVNSMSDLLHEDVSNDYVSAVLGVIAATPQHIHMLLTKRAERLPKVFEYVQSECKGRFMHPALAHHAACIADSDHLFRAANACAGRSAWPLPNLWVGVSVEDRKHGLPRIAHLRQVPAVVRFLSIEPLLEDLGTIDLTGIHWVILGGESGPGARYFVLDWARSIIEQCRAAGVPVFMKQIGAVPFERGEFDVHSRMLVKSRKGNNPAQWPEDLRVRQWPGEARAA